MNDIKKNPRGKLLGLLCNKVRLHDSLVFFFCESAIIAVLKTTPILLDHINSVLH